jgi:hypothetical protein
MKFLVPVLLLLSAPLVLPQDQATFDSCRGEVKELYNAAPISTLPSKECNGIIQVLLPDLRKANGMGYDPQDLTPRRLASLLRYTELATGKAGQRVAAVIYRDPGGCGNHGQCPGYLLGIGPGGVRSLIPDQGEGMSVGGTWGAEAILRKGSVYPDVLVLSSMGPGITVACHRWQGNAYTGDCDVPCVQALTHPNQE